MKEGYARFFATFFFATFFLAGAFRFLAGAFFAAVFFAAGFRFFAAIELFRHEAGKKLLLTSVAEKIFSKIFRLRLL
jgi:hypothetical protein